MALQMGVNGVFEEEENSKTLKIMKLLLDSWFETKLDTDGINGYQELIKVLRHKEVGLNWLANKMKPEHESISDGIPEDHPLKLNRTAAKADVDNQGKDDSHV